MKLHDFLNAPRSAVPAPTRPVTIRLLGHARDGTVVISEAQAALAFVTVAEQDEAHRKADAVCGGSDAADVRFDERCAHVLHLALRDADSPEEFFTKTPLELKNVLPPRELYRLWEEYLTFCAEEFPETISDEEKEALVVEARGKSLLDLLSSRGSRQIQAAWRSLVDAASGTSATPTSFVGSPS